MQQGYVTEGTPQTLSCFQMGSYDRVFRCSWCEKPIGHNDNYVLVQSSHKRGESGLYYAHPKCRGFLRKLLAKLVEGD